MKFIYKGLGVITGLLLMLAVLITSVEFVAYHMEGYYETEYRKYGVTEAVQMEMEDLLFVTEEMMAYLRGDREDLVIHTTIANTQREFFNDKEKKHMVDVQELFMGGQHLRLGAVIIALVLSALLLFLKKGPLLLQGIQRGIYAFFAFMGSLAGLMALNFNRYFVLFHQIFFDNDDWILNPKTDLLINIVPEGFFRDTAFWIAGLFFAGALGIWLLSQFLAKRIKTGE